MEELLGHPWIARHRPQAARLAASDAASEHAVPVAARQQSLVKQISKEEVRAHNRSHAPAAVSRNYDSALLQRRGEPSLSLPICQACLGMLQLSWNMLQCEPADSNDCMQANGSQVYYNITVDASQQRQPPNRLSPATHMQESSSDDVTLDLTTTSVSEQKSLKEVCPFTFRFCVHPVLL